MNKSILIAWALLMALPGCVTETTLVGKNSDRTEGNIDTQTAAKTRLNLAMGYLSKGEMAQAKFNLDKASEFDPSNPDILLTRAYYFQKVGDNVSAERSYKEALAQYPNNADAMNNFGVFLCSNKRYAEADSQFMRAVEQPDYIRMDDTYENAASCAAQSGDKAKAARYFDIALGYSPLNAKLLLEAAELALSTNNTAKAAEYMQRFSQGGHDSAQSLWLKLELAQAQGELAQLHKYGNDLVQQFPQSAQAKRYLNNDY
ncbi:MAG: type IV pilus biogenesis/stability protein PilW [Aeromonadaceae bacterium]